MKPFSSPSDNIAKMIPITNDKVGNNRFNSYLFYTQNRNTDLGCTVEEFNDILGDDPNYSEEPMVGDGGIEMLERVLSDPKLPEEFRGSLMDALSRLQKK